MKDTMDKEFSLKLKAHQIGAVLNALDMVATTLETGGEKLDRRKVLGMRKASDYRQTRAEILKQYVKMP